MSRRLLLAALGVAAALSVASPARACGESTPCAVAGGFYHVRPPPGWDGRTPLRVVVFFHGYQGSAGEVMADREMADALSSAGLALVAPDGEGRTWSYPGSPGRHRDEFAFVTAVLDDLERRFPVDRGRLLASGFSQGGSMVWNLACHLPGRFGGFAPIAGAFWKPLPSDCPAGPANIRHVHGTADATVPIAGRILRGGAFAQGDLHEGWRVWRGVNGCEAPVERTREGDLACIVERRCASGRELRLCLHDGGHDVRARWVVDSARWLDGLVTNPRSRPAESVPTK